MKLLLGAAALSGLATASSQPALGYLFSIDEPDHAAAPIPRQAARLLIQQRLGADGASSLQDLAGLPGIQAGLDALGRLGNQKSLFEDRRIHEPAELVVLIEGVDAKRMEAAISTAQPAFEVADPPSAAAHKTLIKELMLSGVRENACDLRRAINPGEKECWDGSSISIARYDAKKVS
jgi:hypothetical protein